jgi:hypothetical protein
MWGLDNTTPFAAERTWVRNHRGAEIWIVAVKASFVIESDGSLRLDREQAEISRAPEFAGEPATSSLLRVGPDTQKNRTDVLVEGHAYQSAGHANPRRRQINLPASTRRFARSATARLNRAPWAWAYLVGPTAF